jgi:hypothetical protein
MLAALGLAVTSLFAGSANAATSQRTPQHTYSQTAQYGYAHPYMGWSSWSMQAISNSTINPKGSYSWLTEKHVLEQADVMAAKLKQYGYDYINIDAGWWMKWDWTMEYDAYGRPAPDKVRFPDGIAYVARYVHSKGLKLGIYVAVGLNKGAYGDGKTPVWGAPGCTTADVVYSDLRTTNGWDSSYAMDFAKPCAQKYINSIADEFASWGVDFIKIDGVGPGSQRTSGAQYDNRADIAAWDAAIAQSGRPMQIELSWALDQNYVSDWQHLAASWRIENDVECYCSTVTSWNGISARFTDAPKWVGDVGRGQGWMNLDSLDVANGRLDGLTDAERQTAVTLWSIESAPLYSGDDLTQMDSYGYALLTNREVIAIDQSGRAAKPLSTSTDQQVWYTKNANGSYTVALFNLGSASATVSVGWPDLGFSGTAAIRDVWRHTWTGTSGSGYSATVPSHGSVLLKVYPHRSGLSS